VTTDFCLDAVREAITQSGCPAVFNTDPGSQFTSQAFGVQISIDGQGGWWDTGFVERLWRSRKYEAVDLPGYATVNTASLRGWSAR
jgi:putative transposase